MKEPKASEARARLLATATRIFYAEGIHSVGIDRIVAEAQITRATLYRHFPGKEDLVVAYLTDVDRAIRAHVATASATGLTKDDLARVIARGIADDIRRPGFRGCAFLNAATEYPDPAHPVHQVVLAHRKWFADTISELLAEPIARQFVMLRDGAMASGCLAGTEAVCETFLEGVEAILRP